jgi:hypothetical protein
LEDNKKHGHVIGEMPEPKPQTLVTLKMVSPLVITNFNHVKQTTNKKFGPNCARWIPTVSNLLLGKARLSILHAFLQVNNGVANEGDGDANTQESRQEEAISATLREAAPTEETQRVIESRQKEAISATLREAAPTEETQRVIYDIAILLYSLFTKNSTMYRADWIADQIMDEDLNIFNLFITDVGKYQFRIKKKESTTIAETVFNNNNARGNDNTEPIIDMTEVRKDKLKNELSQLENTSNETIALSSLSESSLRKALRKAIFETFNPARINGTNDKLCTIVTVLSQRLSFSICHFLRNVYAARCMRLKGEACGFHPVTKIDSVYCPVCLERVNPKVTTGKSCDDLSVTLY